jgi:hypothetical protein
MSARGWLVALAFVLLAVATVIVFVNIDANSHSVSDTLRPFVITMTPIWIAAIVAARLVTRPRSTR